MKTNKVLTRKMGDFYVLQRTIDGMFNATELLKQWNAVSGQKKVIGHYFENDSTKEFINTIISREFSDIRKSDNVDIQNIKKIYSKQHGGIGGGGSTWMHPYLFLDFAMWLNTEFKYDVIKFVYDQLLKYRNDAGDTYIEMCTAIAGISKKHDIAYNISNVASAINIIVYGRHERELRNKEAEEKSMIELVKMQIKVTELIEDGFIKTYDQLINYLRGVWIKKYQPKELK